MLCNVLKKNNVDGVSRQKQIYETRMYSQLYVLRYLLLLSHTALPEYIGASTEIYVNACAYEYIKKASCWLRHDFQALNIATSKTCN